MSKDIIKTEYDTYWDIYERHLKDEGIKQHVISQRKSTVKKFFRYLCEFDNKPDFEKIRRVNLEHYLSMSEKNLAPKTLNRYFSFLKDFFQYYKHKGINTNIIFENWKYRVDESSEMKILTDSQIKDLKRIIELFELSEKTLRIEICFLILTYTGCTKDELCSLNIYKNSMCMKDDDEVYNYILLDEKEIYFGKKLKNKTKQRMIPLNDYIVEKLIYYMNYLINIHGIDFDKFPYLFPSHYDQESNNYVRLDASQIGSGLKELINASKLINDNGVSFQTFRNTFIKNMVHDEVPLQVIKELSGLEMSSLKRYMNIEQYERDLKENILNERHPFKVLYSSSK